MNIKFVVLLVVLFGYCHYLTASPVPSDSPWIQVELSKDRNQIVYNKDNAFHIMATLQTPNNINKSKRTPIDISCVIDVSGSMAGSKIVLVRKALLYLVTKLQPEDRLSIVMFSEAATTILDWTFMNEVGKQKANEQVSTHIHEKTSTNMGSGLQSGLELFKNRPTDGSIRTSTMILFTDGEANVGFVTPLEYQNLLREYDALLKETHLSIHTFGFGEQHNSQLLSLISEYAKGFYFYIANEELIAEKFALCFKNLFQSYLSHVTLFMHILDRRYYVKTISYPYVTSKEIASAFYDVNVGSMSYSEKRHVLIQIGAPIESNPIDSKIVAKFSISGIDTNGETMNMDLGEVTIERPFQYDSSKEQVNLELDEQLNRLRLKQAIDDSIKEAEKGSYEDAQKVLKDAEIGIVASISSHTDFTSLLLGQIEKLKNYVKDATSYLHSGERHTMLNQRTAHTYEKAMAMDDSNYVTGQDEEEVEEAKSYFGSQDL